MFERFTQDARAVVVAAQGYARELDADRIGPELLLLALARSGSPAAEALAAGGVTAGALERAAAQTGSDLDPDALQAIGIDLDAVRRHADEVFGAGALDRAGGAARGGRRGRRSGHIPFTREAKAVLENALREAVRLGERRLDTRHVLLGALLVDGGPGTVRRAGGDPAVVRAAAERRPAA